MLISDKMNRVLQVAVLPALIKQCSSRIITENRLFFPLQLQISRQAVTLRIAVILVLSSEVHNIKMEQFSYPEMSSKYNFSKF